MSTPFADVSSFAADFTINLTDTPTAEAERLRELEAPRFGTVFTDHMTRITWTSDEGWHDRRIVPFAPLSLNPATSVLHYAQEVFEGLKAYRHDDGTIWSFRPEANAARLQRSAKRLALPEISTEDFLGSIAALVRTDEVWVPTKEDFSLYLRPFAFAAEAFIGVRPSSLVDYLVIASPVGSYFEHGVQPVSIWVAQDFHRAGPGGTGAAKCGGNYAASLLPQIEAYEQGCEQVAFLDATENRYLEELGGMNLFVVKADGSLETPELTGTILEGITRSSILQLVSDRGQTVTERRITLDELLAGIRDGSVAEVFACGTAAVITPIGQFKGDGFDVTVGDGGAGDLTMSLREELTGIQTGKVADRHNWLTRLA